MGGAEDAVVNTVTNNSIERSSLWITKLLLIIFVFILSESMGRNIKQETKYVEYESPCIICLGGCVMLSRREQVMLLLTRQDTTITRLVKLGKVWKTSWGVAQLF